MQTIKVTKGYRRKITANPVKTDGTPAALDEALFGEVIEGEGVTVSQVEGEPKSVYVNAIGEAPGKARVRVSADAHLGEGRRIISAEFDVEIVDEEATKLDLQVSADEESLPS